MPYADILVFQTFLPLLNAPLVISGAAVLILGAVPIAVFLHAYGFLLRAVLLGLSALRAGLHALVFLLNAYLLSLRAFLAAIVGSAQAYGGEHGRSRRQYTKKSPFHSCPLPWINKAIGHYIIRQRIKYVGAELTEKLIRQQAMT
jgi:hypothetical protein